MKSVELYDTTLRDGAQTEGISYSVDDKLRIAKRLDEFGLPSIEGGWPASNPKDLAFFKRAKAMRWRQAEIVAFGATRRARTRASEDANLRGLLQAGTAVITIFGKSWDLHVTGVLRTTLDENLRMIEESVRYLVSHHRRVVFDAEHFFDGYQANPQYALKALEAALSGGAECLALCDTNGGTITSDIDRMVRAVRAALPTAKLGVHLHNDTDMAVASSIAAVLAGVTQVQGTINGYGERCGNANLVSIIPALKLKLGIDCLPDARLKELTEVSRFVDEVSNMRHQDHQPFVGARAFAHKAGVHINAVLKMPRAYEQTDPSTVGGSRRFLISELAGKSGVQLKAEQLALQVDRKGPKARRLLKLLQRLEEEGYHFEAAEGSLELLMRRAMKGFRSFFRLEGFRVTIEKHGKTPPVSEATIQVTVDGTEEHTAATGDGPVNALDNALRKALAQFYPSLKEMRLTDFKVRVINEKAGTAAKVRVLIQSQDEHDSWWTVGVSENIIEASWQALVDSIEYKLLKDRKSQ